MSEPLLGTSKSGDRDTAAVAEVRAMIFRKLRVKVVDGRVFFGFLNCFDKRGNIILTNAIERKVGEDGETTERHVGFILILPEHRLETHVLDDGTSRAEGALSNAAEGLVNLSLVDHPPPNVDLII